MPSCSPTMGTLMCQDVLFNTGLGKITLTHLSTAFRMGWLEWCKNTIFWAGVCWFYDQRKGSQLNYNLTHKVETALAGSAFFLGQFFHQSLVPPSLPRSLSQAGRCVSDPLAMNRGFPWPSLWFAITKDIKGYRWKPDEIHRVRSWKVPECKCFCGIAVGHPPSV